LAKQLDLTHTKPGLPAPLVGKPEAAVLYNNLPMILASTDLTDLVEEPTASINDEMMLLALKLDHELKTKAPAGWRGDQARESQVLNTIHSTLGNTREATLAVFNIVKNLPGY
jgi:type I restriction enzyme R subunit